jgi:rhodanese-related sulfurtransferase
VNKHKSPIETLEAAEVATLLNAGKLLLIDVREPAEYASERIAGALLFPLSTFDAASLPDDGAPRVVFHCGSGKKLQGYPSLHLDIKASRPFRKPHNYEDS